MIRNPQAGKLAPIIENLVEETITELGNDDTEDVGLYLEMLKGNCILGSMLEIETLIAFKELGEYHNENEEIQAFIRRNLEQMRGSLGHSFAEMYQCTKGLGYNCSEVAMMQTEGEWTLDTLLAINPTLYKFRGSAGQVTELLYKGKNEIAIPYDRVIHTVSGLGLSFSNPYGIATCKRALAPWRAWKIFNAQMLIAGQRNATPITVGYADSNDRVAILDSTGQPIVNTATGEVSTIPAPQALANQLVQLENNAVVTTDLKNKIEALNVQTGGAFFFQAIALCEEMMMKAFSFPNTVLSTAGNGSGDSNLNAGHRTVWMMSIHGLVDQISEAILEQLIRPLIVWNFGEQEEGYGEFKKDIDEDGDRLQLLSILGSIMSGQALSQADIQWQNRLRELAGIPPIDSVTTMMQNRVPNYFEAKY
jgi:hypothetical protein